MDALQILSRNEMKSIMAGNCYQGCISTASSCYEDCDSLGRGPGTGYAQCIDGCKDNSDDCLDNCPAIHP